MRLSNFNYDLPPRRIAQAPLHRRDQSRLMVLDRRTGRCQHRRFFELPRLLAPGDVLVMNNSRVFPARLVGRTMAGGYREIFLLHPVRGHVWEVLIGGRMRQPGATLWCGRGLRGTVVGRRPGGIWHMRFSLPPSRVYAIAELIGQTPTPPYIKRPASRAEYQTVYASRSQIGSVAAPTAGFHFTVRLLNQLKRMGVQLEYVTLHVGFGTFQPVTTPDITRHQMHAEYAAVDRGTMQRIHQAQQEKRRIIAVGTTAVRVLETVCGQRTTADSQKGFGGWINTYLYPGYRFRMVDAMITNFHLPQSTLLMLVAAFAGRRHILAAYQKAIRRGYRFYSFGDAMFIQ